MQLSEKQIQRLFEFTEKKSVKWYDLQIELVDHLASRIEEEMNANAFLTFESALDKVYSGFGIFGFAKIVQEKTTQIQKSSRKMWWSEVRSFITWPKIIVLAVIFTALWQLAQLFDTGILMYVFVGVYIATAAIMIRYINKTSKMQKKLLLLQAGPAHFSSSVFFYEVMVFSSSSNFSPLKFCVYATIGILFKVASFQVYAKVKERATSEYPEAFA